MDIKKIKNLDGLIRSAGGSRERYEVIISNLQGDKEFDRMPYLTLREAYDAAIEIINKEDPNARFYKYYNEVVDTLETEDSTLIYHGKPVTDLQVLIAKTYMKEDTFVGDI